MNESDPSTFAVLSLSLLGVRLTLRCDRPEALELLRSSLAAFETEDSSSSIVIDVRLEANPPYAEVSSHRRRIDRRQAAEQVFGLAMSTILEHSDEFLVLHGAGVAIAGKAFLISGPSGSGKSTLALALAARGLSLLSDDFVPLHRKSKLAHPFPKAINVRPGRSRELAEALAPEWNAADGDGRLSPGHEHWTESPLPLGGIVLFDGDPTPPSPLDAYCVSICHDRHGDEMVAALEEIPGVSVLRHVDGDLSIRVDPKMQPRAGLDSFLHRFNASILEYSLVSPGPLHTDKPPETKPLAGTSALMLILREIQNRHESGALLASVGGDMTRIASELAAAIAGCPCAWLMPGTPEATAEHLESLFRRWAKSE